MTKVKHRFFVNVHLPILKCPLRTCLVFDPPVDVVDHEPTVGPHIKLETYLLEGDSIRHDNIY